MATIKEVADLAQVSVGTVSHVITRTVPVSEQLRDRVHAAIRVLDYHPNHVARSLKTSRTRTLGIIVPDMTISFFPQIIRGADDAARKLGYWLIAANSIESAERQGELISLLRSQQVEGILLVVAAAPTPSDEMLRLIGAGIPVVCLDRVPEDIPVDSVSVDDVAAAAMGTDHLLSQGYKDIAIVTGSLSLKNEQGRVLGYQQSLGHAGTVWQAEECAAMLKSGAAKPDAILCTNGPAALKALRALHDLEWRIPEDIGFATFDELTVDDLFRPAITTIVQPAYEIGHRAAEILLERIEKGRKTADVYTDRLPATLRVRESSMPMRDRTSSGAAEDRSSP